jgi:hypothetical protein
MNAESYELLVLIREFDERAGWLKWSLSSCAQWLHWRCDLSLSAAREKVRVAHALKPLPAISKSFSTGELSYSKARALTRVADVENETDLLAFALKTTTMRVQERCQQIRNVSPHATDHANRNFNSRSLRSWRDEDRGMITIKLEVPIEDASLFQQALDKAVDSDLAAGTKADGPNESSSWSAMQADDVTDDDVDKSEVVDFNQSLRQTVCESSVCQSAERSMNYSTGPIIERANTNTSGEGSDYSSERSIDGTIDSTSIAETRDRSPASTNHVRYSSIALSKHWA